jgi:hypothetical protein
VRGRRAAALWLLLFAVYASTLGMHAFGRSDYAGDEPHYLLTAKSIVQDGDPDLRDDYATRGYSEFYPYRLTPQGALTKGRVNEPHSVGFALVIAPAYAIAGAKGVEVFMAALTALALVLAYALARCAVPDPWALGATLAVGLSPPLLAYSTAVNPEPAAAAALCGAALLALRIPNSPRRRAGWTAFGLIALLPWLGTQFLLPGLVIAIFGYRAIRAARRPVLAITCAEIVGFSVALFVGVNEGLFGGPTPSSANAPGQGATGADFPAGYLGRSYRVVGLFIDRHYGLLRWAPIFAFALYGVWLLAREQRSGLARAIPELRTEQTAGLLCAAVAGAQLFVAVFLSRSMSGFWFPAHNLVPVLPVAVPLVAVALRHSPRVGTLLGAIGVAASAWLYVAIRSGDAAWVAPLPDAPFGPLTDVLPRYGHGGVYPYALAAIIVLGGVTAAVWAERRRALRRPAAR